MCISETFKTFKNTHNMEYKRDYVIIIVIIIVIIYYYKSDAKTISKSGMSELIK